MADKQRLDVALCERNLIESRQKAKAIIMSGQVYVNGNKQTKAGFIVHEDDSIEVRGEKLPFVSRGGFKLDKALKVFDIKLENFICMDIGASTGGFSDVMLQNGAAKVYAIDVGYGQLAWKLRTDGRIVNMERTNFRYCTKEDINDEIDFASVDVSFISLKIILPVLKIFLKENASAVCLIKPQFEAGKEKVGKNGVVRDPETHKDVVCSVIDFAKSIGFSIAGLSFSPIKGPQGNVEYLLHIKNQVDNSTFDEEKIDIIIRQSHLELDK